MAEVFLAELAGAAGFSKRLAIKRVRGAYAFDRDVARAFIDEARLAQRLQHGNIVQIYDLGLEGKCPYLVMEYVDGLSLGELLSGYRKSERKLAVGDALHIIERVSDALDYAHRLADADGSPIGVVHRDVNPRNILISGDGVVKLTDFGIAKALHQPSRTLPGRVKGTLGYMSPEQATGQAIDARSDQFATGVVLYQLLAGRNPLAEVESLRGYRELITRGLPPLEGIDAELSAAIARATATSPADRFESMAELRAELEEWRVRRGIRTSHDGLRSAVRRFRGGPEIQGQARLDDVLLAQLGDDPEDGTRHLPAARSPRRWRWLWAVAGVTLAGAVVAMGAALFGESDGDAVAAEIVDAAAETEAEPEPETESETETETETGAETEAEPELVIIDAGVTADAATPHPDPPPVGGREEKRRRPTEVRADPGTLKVNVLPWAWVSIDGVRVGKTPLRRSVAAGAHVLELFNPQTGQRERQRIRVEPGKTVVVKRW